MFALNVLLENEQKIHCEFISVNQYVNFIMLWQLITIIIITFHSPIKYTYPSNFNYFRMPVVLQGWNYHCWNYHNKNKYFLIKSYHNIYPLHVSSYYNKTHLLLSCISMMIEFLFEVSQKAFEVTMRQGVVVGKAFQANNEKPVLTFNF